MSFLTRILSRAAPPGIRQAPLARPKGGRARLDAAEDEAVYALRRQEDEEEPVQTLRRQEQEDEESVQPLRRQEQEDEESVQPLRRQEQEDEESVQPLRREQQEDEESVQALRRQEEEEEDIQALRRQEDEEEDVQALRRLTPPAAENLSADNSPQPDELAPESAVSALQALHREALMPGSGSTAPGTSLATGAVPVTPVLEAPGMPEPASPEGPASVDVAQHGFIPAPHATQATAERPRVIIDQIDVVIHEEAAATAPASPTAALGRALKAKYLGGL